MFWRGGVGCVSEPAKGLRCNIRSSVSTLLLKVYGVLKRVSFIYVFGLLTPGLCFFVTQKFGQNLHRSHRKNKAFFFVGSLYKSHGDESPPLPLRNNKVESFRDLLRD